jgi:hypothetical protein
MIESLPILLTQDSHVLIACSLEFFSLLFPDFNQQGVDKVWLTFRGSTHTQAYPGQAAMFTSSAVTAVEG